MKPFVLEHAAFAAAYFMAISLYALCITVIDKKKAQKNKWRISEFHLMTVGFLGGALAMYVTMRSIHHKTRHKKFMIGLPLEILLHSFIIVLILFI